MEFSIIKHFYTVKNYYTQKCYHSICNVNIEYETSKNRYTLWYLQGTQGVFDITDKKKSSWALKNHKVFYISIFNLSIPFKFTIFKFKFNFPKPDSINFIVVIITRHYSNASHCATLRAQLNFTSWNIVHQGLLK